MRRIRFCSVCLVLILVIMGGPQALASRLIILADMGNEPDEVQQMAHMIMCSNEFELEGLIAVSGIYLMTIDASSWTLASRSEWK